MAVPHHLPAPRLGQVRWIVWAALVGSMLVALSMPLLTLWDAAHAPLSAHVCLWPPHPQARELVQLIVSVPDATDRDALAGPWAHLHIAWDMVTMPMDTHPITLAGTAERAGSFSVPLQVDMAGLWRADLSLQTPGRPAWQTQVQFTVATAGSLPAATPGASGGATLAVCTGTRAERKSIV